MNARTMMGSLGLFLFLTASAAAPAAAEGKGPVLVWGVSAVTDLPEDQVSAIASWLPGEVERTTGLDVVDEEVIDEGIDLAMDNGECRENNMACVIEVARALWVSEAVYGDIGIINGVYILTLRRVDAASGKVIKQVSAQTNRGVDVLIQSMSDMIATLYDIPHNQLGTVRALGRNDGYDYVIVTYGPWFSWIEPVVWYHYYPWWWSGSVHYYHHHHAWWGWHHRHPHGRPYHHGPRREYPHRDHHHRGHHDGHNGGGKYDGDRHDHGDLERPSDVGAGQKGHRLDSDRKIEVRPAVRPVEGTDRTDPSKVNHVIDRGSGFDRPAVSPRPVKDVVPPKGAVQRPQPQKHEVRKPYQPRPQVKQPDARPGNSNRAPAVNRPSSGGGKPAVRGGAVGSPSSGKKKSSGSNGSSGTSKPSSGKSKSSGSRGIGGGGGGAKPAGTRGGH